MPRRKTGDVARKQGAAAEPVHPISLILTAEAGSNNTAGKRSSKMSPRQIRLYWLKHWRSGITTYAQYCALPLDWRERLRNWGVTEPQYFNPRHFENDQVSHAVRDVAMRIEVEIALITGSQDQSAHFEVLTDTLGQALDEAAAQAVFEEAHRRLHAAEELFLERAKRSEAPQVFRFPQLVEADEVAQALRLTMLRKEVIWGGKLRIKAINLPTPSPVAQSPFTKEQHQEHRRLGKRYNRKPETVADWRRRGSEFFTAKVSEMEALLSAQTLEHHWLEGEHPMRTATRLRREMKSRQRHQKMRGTSVTAEVRAEAAATGHSERTIWRRRAQASAAQGKEARQEEPMSHSVSDDVTLSAGVARLSRPFESGDTPDISQQPSRNSDPGVKPKARKRSTTRVPPEAIAELKQWYLETTGKQLSDDAIRQRRYRRTLDDLLDEMWVDRTDKAVRERDRALDRVRSADEEAVASTAELTPVKDEDMPF